MVLTGPPPVGLSVGTATGLPRCPAERHGSIRAVCLATWDYVEDHPNRADQPAAQRPYSRPGSRRMPIPRARVRRSERGSFVAQSLFTNRRGLRPVTPTVSQLKDLNVDAFEVEVQVGD